MATCSSIEEPVLVFQLPEMDVLLFVQKHLVYIVENLYDIGLLYV